MVVEQGLVWLCNQLEVEGNDLLGEVVRSFAQGLMSAEADVVRVGIRLQACVGFGCSSVLT